MHNMITVATWNINSIKVRLDHVLNWLGRHQPDFLFLQEIKCTTEAFPADAFQKIGYHAHVVGMPGYNGVATLTRHADATVAATALPGDDSDLLARFLQLAWQDWTLINIYAPNGNPVGTEKFTYKLGWLDRLHRHLEGLLADHRQFLVGGDFNIIPQFMDARNPQEWRHDALFQPESRQKWQALCHLGLTDAYRALYPDDDQAYSFWDYQAGSWQRDNGIRIDHFLLSPKAADRLQACAIDKEPRGQEKPSDHTPVIVTFDL